MVRTLSRVLHPAIDEVVKEVDAFAFVIIILRFSMVGNSKSGILSKKYQTNISTQP